VDQPGLILARAVMLLALLLAAGLPLYRLIAGRPLSRAVPVLLAPVAMAASVWWALESVAAMAAMPLGDLDRAMVSSVLDATPLGMVLNVRAAALLVMSGAMVLPTRVRLVPAALGGAVALGSAAWTGHAGATEAALGTLHRSADVLHLLAAATWIGALISLLVASIRRASLRDLAHELAAFSRTGTVVVALLLATGTVNTLAIVGWPTAPQLTSRWALALAIKLALFAVMLGLAAHNRWQLTPGITSGTVGRWPLIRSLTLETGAGIAVVVIVGWLGVLDPGA
jgi:putative copper resistance protein D